MAREAVEGTAVDLSAEVTARVRVVGAPGGAARVAGNGAAEREAVERVQGGTAVTTEAATLEVEGREEAAGGFAPADTEAAPEGMGFWVGEAARGGMKAEVTEVVKVGANWEMVGATAEAERAVAATGEAATEAAVLAAEAKGTVPAVAQSVAAGMGAVLGAAEAKAAASEAAATAVVGEVGPLAAAMEVTVAAGGAQSVAVAKAAVATESVATVEVPEVTAMATAVAGEAVGERWARCARTSIPGTSCRPTPWF